MSGINNFLKNASKTVSKRNIILEASIEDAFVKYAKSKGCKALKLILLNKRGFPDRTVLTPNGGILFIEFKKKGEKLRSTQIPVKKILTDLGFEYYVCDEKGQAEKQLDRYISKNRKTYYEMDS